MSYIFDEDHRWVTCIELAKRYRRETKPKAWGKWEKKGKRKRPQP